MFSIGLIFYREHYSASAVQLNWCAANSISLFIQYVLFSSPFIIDFFIFCNYRWLDYELWKWVVVVWTVNSERRRLREAAHLPSVTKMPLPSLNIEEGLFPRWPSSVAPWLRQDPLKPSQPPSLPPVFFFFLLWLSCIDPFLPLLLPSFRKGESRFDLSCKWSWHLNRQHNQDNVHSCMLRG